MLQHNNNNMFITAALQEAAEAGRELPMIVPKWIHQTWKTMDIPTEWKDASESCRKLHPDYKYKVWICVVVAVERVVMAVAWSLLRRQKDDMTWP